ncbi:MAG: cellulose biosynthesis cyclic di-GMP-binding regulatory protein BcsB [Phyllobacteriaceae bacterium]|nr:cellulose biosynthesis cyclic di-GMP-binding regulatory protein BcsB [Phyllobacteriaceae bacterium]
MRMTTMAMLLLATTTPVWAETVTVSTTLADRGLTDGMLLSGRGAGTFYLPLPTGVDVSNVRVIMDGKAVTPNMQRGSVVVSVNGQPVEALRLREAQSAQNVALEALMAEGQSIRASGLDVRFRADLIAEAEACGYDYDPANTLQILPTTSVSFDVDLAAVNSVGDALALLPAEPTIVLGAPLTEAASAVGLQLARSLASRGYRAQFATEANGDDPVSIRVIESGAQTRLVHEAGKLVVEVASDVDVSALSRLWQAAPAALVGEVIEADSTNVAGTASVSGFWAAPALPGAVRVLQTADLGLDFGMLDVNGRVAQEARLRLTVAPDWSTVKPIVTIYLNGQLIVAQRAEVGENIIRAPLPQDLLQLSNRLTVTVDRAQEEGYCPGPNPGHAVQLLPGTGVAYGEGKPGGFASVGAALRVGGTVVLPADSGDEERLGYLELAARVLPGLGSGVSPLEVSFGDVTPTDGQAVIRIAESDAAGLSLPIASNRGRPDLTFSTDRPMASLVADAATRRLDVTVLEGQGVPDPEGVFLANGAEALIGDKGVIWQDTPTGTDPSLIQRVREASRGMRDVLRAEGLLWGGIAVGFVAFILVARGLIAQFFRRRSRK